MLNRVNFDITVPGSDLEFYRLTYQHQQMLTFGRIWTIEVRGNISYADGYGDTGDIPPYEHFFAGGADSVRGFRDGTVGPRDTPFNNPYGGKFKTTLQTELFVPMPFLESDGKSTRLALFYDAGNVFAEPSDFDLGEIRSSSGVAVYWFTPFFGLLKISYAIPLESQSTDEEDRFQISFGLGF